MRLIDADKLSSEMEFVFENARGMTALAARLVWAFVERADTVPFCSDCTKMATNATKEQREQLDLMRAKAQTNVKPR